MQSEHIAFVVANQQENFAASVSYILWSSRSQVFFQKGVLLQYLQENTCVGVSF